MITICKVSDVPDSLDWCYNLQEKEKKSASTLGQLFGGDLFVVETSAEYNATLNKFSFYFEEVEYLGLDFGFLNSARSHLCIGAFTNNNGGPTFVIPLSVIDNLRLENCTGYFEEEDIQHVVNRRKVEQENNSL